MTALAAPLSVGLSSGLHKLALGLVWLAVASSAIVFTEPAPVDVLTMGLVVLLPTTGLIAISPPLIVLLALMLIAAAGAILGATNATDLSAAMSHTGITAYLYLATFVFAAFVAKRPQAHCQLILNAYVWAAVAAALLGIVGYFDLVAGAHEIMTRYDRATGLFKDPNVFGPFLVPALIYGLSQFARARGRESLMLFALLLVIGFGMLLSFSRGAWTNLGLAVVLYSGLHLLTVRGARARLKFALLVATGMAAVGALVVIALQFDGVSDLAQQRASLDQSYDEGPEGRFGGQVKAASLILENPLGIGAQQFAPQYHREEPHNVYLAVFLNAGWLGGLAFLALVGMSCVWGLRHAFRRSPTQPLFLVIYASLVANAFEGTIIDLDHWRHFYLLMALLWGLMLANVERHRR
jgi:O-antigen ligase